MAYVLVEGTPGEGQRFEKPGGMYRYKPGGQIGSSAGDIQRFRGLAKRYSLNEIYVP